LNRCSAEMVGHGHCEAFGLREKKKGKKRREKRMKV
jgi:hypothetical protein